MIVKNCTLKKPISCHENDSIIEVAKILRDNSLRNIIIVNDDNQPIGIVSSVDMVNKIIAEASDYKGLTAKHVMISPVFYINENEQVSKAYLNMIKHNTYSYPVVSAENKFVGILSFTESVKYLSNKIVHGKVIG